MSSTSIERMHAELSRRHASLKGAIVRHKQVIGVTVNRTLAAIEATVGGGAAAAIDFYMGEDGAAIPEAMVGPVPVVMTAAVALTALSILMQGEEWSGHLGGFANGLAGASTYAEGLRFLKAHDAAAPAAAHVGT